MDGRQSPLPRDGASAHTAIFVHIPKTAGTTLSRIIERQYARAHTYTIMQENGPFSGSQDDFRQLSAGRRASLQLVKGHVAFGMHRELQQSSSYFTLLRQPVARVLSHYAHARRDPQHNLHPFMKRMSLREALTAGGSEALAFDNFQTRLISGVWNTVPFGALEDDVLQTAIGNLQQHFAVVGLVERFDDTLLLLQRLYGWRFVYYTRHNTGGAQPGAPGADAETIALVHDHNRLDERLYAYAGAHLERQIAQAGDEFTAQLNRFRTANRFVSPFLRLYWQARKVSVRQALAEIGRRP